jgi:hypothetical protein
MPREFKQVDADTAWSTVSGSLGCLQGQIDAAPAKLIDVFGEPEEGDGCKVSGEYYFQDVEDPKKIFYVYDWKSTTLYDPEAWRPSELWGMTSDYDFHIGGQSTEGLEDFKNWLNKKLEIG